ncbi:MAG: stage III sporulation protein AG [Oscillospiraceae bacterium]|nr:stage III sporulation protein AG [Oscillospiraceae bacterium]
MKTVAWKKILGKYKFPLLILLAGVLLMVIPSLGKKSSGEITAATVSADYSLEEIERRMEEVLSQIDGVGKMRLLLTVSGASQLCLAQDVDSGSDRDRRETVTVNRGSGYQEVVVTGEVYPTYQGAVIVCQGAGSNAVRLALIEAVSALTGLTADKIAIEKWKHS